MAWSSRGSAIGLATRASKPASSTCLRSWVPTLAVVGQLGLTMAGCILAGFFLGTLLDRRFHSSPALTIALLLAGIGGGMVVVYRTVMHTVRTAPRGVDDQRKCRADKGIDDTDGDERDV